MPAVRHYGYVKDWSSTFDSTAPPGGGSIRGRPQEDPFEPQSSSSESEDGEEGSEYQPSDYDMSDNDLSDPEDSGYEDSESKLLDRPLNIVFKVSASPRPMCILHCDSPRFLLPQRRDPVWIKMQGKWYHGKVIKVLRSAKRPQVMLRDWSFPGNTR